MKRPNCGKCGRRMVDFTVKYTAGAGHEHVSGFWWCGCWGICERDFLSSVLQQRWENINEVVSEMEPRR